MTVVRILLEPGVLAARLFQRLDCPAAGIPSV